MPEESQGTQAPSRNISPTDSAAQWTAARGGPAFYAYSTNYLIDLSAGIIVDVEATLANRTPEVESTRTVIDRVEERFDIRPRRRVGDTAYGTAPLLGWLVEDKQIEPHVPVWDKTIRKDGSLSIDEFRWVPEHNELKACCALWLPELDGESLSAITNAGKIRGEFFNTIGPIRSSRPLKNDRRRSTELLKLDPALRNDLAPCRGL